MGEILKYFLVISILFFGIKSCINEEYECNQNGGILVKKRFYGSACIMGVLNER